MMMRQMLVSLVAAGALVGGAAASAGAQDAGASPVQVETLEIEPTVVKTGDVITQVYRVRFPDLIAQGREIIILEDRMVPENLPIHPFEAVSLEIRKRQVESEHIWDFAYGMRLIAPEKAVYVVPSFGFYYLVRDLGEDIEDAEIQQIDGGQGLVRYVTTMNDLPILDIRDTIELGEFGGQAVFFRAMAWAVAPLPLLLWLVFLVRLARKPKTVSLEAAREAEELDRIEAQIPVPPSIWEARRTLRAQLRALAGAAQGGGAAVISGLIISARDYLRAELPDVNSGDTPRDIKAHVDGLKDGARKEALSTLASRLVVYQDGLERGEVSIENPAGEVAALDASLTALRPHIRLWRGMLAFVGR
ncbi:MAG: hypothetical protein OXH69_18365 [Acidobacteria bacterium]|nr:hypothetical protein [Acidobacteriota bacterium]